MTALRFLMNNNIYPFWRPLILVFGASLVTITSKKGITLQWRKGHSQLGDTNTTQTYLTSTESLWKPRRFFLIGTQIIWRLGTVITMQQVHIKGQGYMPSTKHLDVSVCLTKVQGCALGSQDHHC